MANYNAKYRVKNSSGDYDTIYFETTAEQVILSDDSSLEQAISESVRAEDLSDGSLELDKPDGLVRLEVLEEQVSNGVVNSARKLEAARKITIGEATKYFDGLTDISWTLSEIGLANSTVATEEKDGLMSSKDKSKLNNIEAKANYYIHPEHEGIRHVTDFEKQIWNNKAEKTHTHQGFAEKEHTHQGFAEKIHSHQELAEKEHTHQGFVSNEDPRLSDAREPLAHTHTPSEIGAVASNTVRTIFTSTSDPTNADGQDGDLWIKYVN